MILLLKAAAVSCRETCRMTFNSPLLWIMSYWPNPAGHVIITPLSQLGNFTSNLFQRNLFDLERVTPLEKSTNDWLENSNHE